MKTMSKIALITGANKGIGLETARQLARDHGFTVLVGARDSERGNTAVDELKAEGLNAEFIAIDPTDAESVAKAAQEVEAKYGHLDVLINNAGTIVDGDFAPPAQVETSVLRDTYDINVFALHEVTRTFWPLLEKSEAARLVNVSSLLGSLTAHSDGTLGDYKVLAYDSSKAAVNMLTTHYAWQWKNTPHKANTIHPGSVKTDLNKQGDLTVEEGAKTSVDLAIIDADGPNGEFFHLGQKLPW
ncbi:SDR family oxidoreductase [bacterium]|nr:MAG: SDR family oxidoreductase [bacterium]